MSNPRVRAALVVVAPLLLAGCFTYVPAEPGRVEPGGELRLLLTPDARAELPEGIVSGERWVRGRVMAWRNDDVLVRVPLPGRDDGLPGPAIGQDVEVRLADVVEVERRELSRSRTALLVGGVGVATAVLLSLIIEDFGGADGDVDGPELIRVPLLSVPAG